MNTRQLREKMLLIDDIEKHGWQKEDMREVQQLFHLKRKDYHGRKEYCFDLMTADMIEVVRQLRMTYIPPHFHTYMELIYVYGGKFVNVIGNSEISVMPGEVLLLDENVFHSVKTLTEDDIVISINLNKDLLSTDITEKMEVGSALMEFFLRAGSVHSRHENYILFHPGDEKETVQRLVEMILCETYEKQSNSDDVIPTAVTLLLQYLSRVSNIETNMEYRGKGSRSMLDCDELLHFIELHYQDCTLDMLEKQFRFNPHYISSYLRKKTGMSFKEILLKEKLEHAKVLLDGTSLPIIHIIEIVGFSNPTFFYKKFEEYYHIPLSQYQRKK